MNSCSVVATQQVNVRSPAKPRATGFSLPRQILAAVDGNATSRVEQMSRTALRKATSALPSRATSDCSAASVAIGQLQKFVTSRTTVT